LPPGRHTARARKLGYAPQVREFVISDSGAIVEFELLPIPRALPAMVSSVPLRGLSGVVGDSAFIAIEGATVRVLGDGLETQTDSVGRFYLPAKAGHFMVSILKPGYRSKLVAVTIPSDSGRRMTAWLEPGTVNVPVREAHNIDNLQERQAWRSPSHSTLYTRKDLVRMNIEWVYQAVATVGPKFGAREAFSQDCMAIVNGGPAVTNTSLLTVDEVESVELYPTGASGVPGGFRLGARGAVVKTQALSLSNTNRAVIENSTRNCPLIYVWLR
jgi:hypothetical protein